MKRKPCVKMVKAKKVFEIIGCISTLMIINIAELYTQNGNAGIDEANNKVRSYFDSGINLMYAAGPYLFLGENDEASNQFTPLLIKVIGVFAVHIGVIAASYFSANYTLVEEKANERHYIAFSLIILWLIGFLSFVMINGASVKNTDTTIEIVNKDIDTFNAGINFLIVGALIFLFVNVKQK